MVTLADIFAQHGSAYQQQFAAQMLPTHRQTMQAILQCRTAALGGQVTPVIPVTISNTVTIPAAIAIAPNVKATRHSNG